eukprot:TRINITY_DN9850_c0_g1_i1.p3 TRINITY_DN9850_c0_g1~~TRINITY_DN9850_c0_g1_i1.p3  ORF type:complete len:118 (-),score=0.27 TRINITY_DN9850_c0_g1_i1:139-492(-)
MCIQQNSHNQYPHNSHQHFNVKIHTILGVVQLGVFKRILSSTNYEDSTIVVRIIKQYAYNQLKKENKPNQKQLKQKHLKNVGGGKGFFQIKYETKNTNLNIIKQNKCNYIQNNLYGQ